jgi:hypothetical protein
MDLPCRICLFAGPNAGLGPVSRSYPAYFPEFGNREIPVDDQGFARCKRGLGIKASEFALGRVVSCLESAI